MTDRSAVLLDLVERVRAARPLLGPVKLVAVDGPSGSGKTCFAQQLLAALTGAGMRATVVPTDDFATWDEPVQWWPRLVSGVLEPLRRGRPGGYRRIEWPDGEPVLGAHVTVPVPEVLVLEGVSAARREISDRVSVAVWVEEPDPALRLERAVRRDGPRTRPHLQRWQEFERSWFAADGTRARADVVVSG